MSRAVPPAIRFAACVAIVLLTVVGAVAGVLRAWFPADLGSRLEPARVATLQMAGRQEPAPDVRAREIARFDATYDAHRVATMFHVLPGVYFVLLAPLQFSASIRSRWPRFHRWNGRVLVATAIPLFASALYFGWLMPFAGASESFVITIAAALFATGLARGVAAIRRGQIERHRAWMIRAFAVSLGVGLSRVVSGIIDFQFAEAGFDVRHLLVFSLALAWMLTIGAGELWIARTRTHPRSIEMAGVQTHTAS